MNLICEKCGHEWSPRTPNPMKCPLCQHNRRKQLSDILRHDALTRDGFACRDCGKPQTSEESLHVHHDIPRSQNGTDDLNNLVSLCNQCHKARHKSSGQKKFHRSKTYSLSDEVVEAIEAAKAGGLSPNQFLRRVIGIDESDNDNHTPEATAKEVKDWRSNRAPLPKPKDRLKG